MPEKSHYRNRAKLFCDKHLSPLGIISPQLGEVIQHLERELIAVAIDVQMEPRNVRKK
jgi:hypothetical protein